MSILYLTVLTGKATMAVPISEKKLACSPLFGVVCSAISRHTSAVYGKNRCEFTRKMHAKDLQNMISIFSRRNCDEIK